MGTPLRKATAQKRASRIFSRGKQTGPGSAPRRGIGGGLRAGRAAAVRRATLARIMAHRTGRDVLRVPLPAAGKQAGDAVGAVWIYRPRSRLFARHPSRIAAHRARCRRFPAASNPGPAPRRGIGGGLRAGRAAAVRRATLARIMAHRTGRDVLRVPLPAAGKQAGDAVGAVWIYRPRSRLFARHPSRIAAHRARCRRFPAASNPGPAPRRGISGGQRRLARRPCSCCPARHPARILVLRWSAQDAAAEPYEYALDCASDRKAYAWPPLPRTPHPRLTRWQRAFYHPFLWRTLCYGKRWIVRAGKRKDAGASARAA